MVEGGVKKLAEEVDEAYAPSSIGTLRCWSKSSISWIVLTSHILALRLSSKRSSSEDGSIYMFLQIIRCKFCLRVSLLTNEKSWRNENCWPVLRHFYIFCCTFVGLSSTFINKRMKFFMLIFICNFFWIIRSFIWQKKYGYSFFFLLV